MSDKPWMNIKQPNITPIEFDARVHAMVDLIFTQGNAASREAALYILFAMTKAVNVEADAERAWETADEKWRVGVLGQRRLSALEDVMMTQGDDAQGGNGR